MTNLAWTIRLDKMDSTTEAASGAVTVDAGQMTALKWQPG
jgi:hypothetical protein